MGKLKKIRGLLGNTWPVHIKLGWSCNLYTIDVFNFAN